MHLKDTIKSWLDSEVEFAKTRKCTSINELSKSGMMVNGSFYEVKLNTKSIPVTLFPTPTAQLAGESFLKTLRKKNGQPPEPNKTVYNPQNNRTVQITLNRYVKMWPLVEDKNLRLNSTWVDWLMGFPLSWSEPSSSQTVKMRPLTK